MTDSIKTLAGDRDNRGRFAGNGAFESELPPPQTRFTPVEQAETALRQALESAFSRFSEANNDEEDLPVVVCRASPGAGKSRTTRLLLAARYRHANGTTSVAFHLPTLDLAEEAAEEARLLGVSAQAIRGRSARRPDGTGTMCEKADLLEQAVRLGLPVKKNFCRSKDNERRERFWVTSVKVV